MDDYTPLCAICRKPISDERPSEYRGEMTCGDCRRKAKSRARAERAVDGNRRRPPRPLTEAVRHLAGSGNQGPGCVHSEDALPCTDCFLEGEA